MWHALAWLLSRPAVASWLIARAQRTPYVHLDGYMHRWWLFNPYLERSGSGSRYSWCPISIRVHHILRSDHGRDLHDHPWNARTILLRGWYTETREGWGGSSTTDEYHVRRAGDTATLQFGEFHRINQVSEGGVYTLFITGRYRGTWGFKVNGSKVPHREYLGDHQ